jgi:thiol-disulfide isomerase/thioredoxin
MIWLRSLKLQLLRPLRLSDMDDSPFRLEDHAGQVVLVNFRVSWCRPCVTEIPSLHRLYAAVDEDDFRIVTVKVDEDRERISGFLQQLPVELPVLMDYDASISKDWMIHVYPSSYIWSITRGKTVTLTLEHWNGIQQKT